MSAFELSLFVRSSSVMTLRTGPHSALVPRLLAQLSSDWCRIDIELVTDWHDICQLVPVEPGELRYNGKVDDLYEHDHDRPSHLIEM